MPFDVFIGAPALESLHSQLDLGRQTVKISMGDLSAERNLHHGISKSKVTRSTTDSEDFTSDPGILTETYGPDGDVFFVAADDDVQFEPGLRTGTPDFDNERMPELIAEGFGSDENELEILEDDWVGFQDQFDTIGANAGHLPDSEARGLIGSLYDSGIIVWSLDDLRPAEVLIEHTFELRDESPIRNRIRRLPPRHADVVREEVYKMLLAEIITPSISAW